MTRTRTRTRPDVLSGRVAVVTGAGSGIGRALAQALAARRCPLVLVDRDADGLADTVASVEVPVLSRTLDVRERWAHQQLAADVQGWGQGPLGVVVNNAGVALAQTTAHTSVEDLQWVMDVNFWGVVHGTQAFLPLLQEQDSGTIVNISSLFGLVGWPTQSAYCASKFAVRGFTESLRHELHGTGVRAVCVHPGGIATNIVRNGKIEVDELGNTDRRVLEADFEQVARTTPATAAQVILSGLDAGRDRILIGADAKTLDVWQRLRPVGYYGLVRRLRPLASRRR